MFSEPGCAMMPHAVPPFGILCRDALADLLAGDVQRLADVRQAVGAGC